MRKNMILSRTIAYATASSLLFSQFLQVAQAVTLATAPLANITTSVVRPNIMYVLDDSGSMAWDYTPDYVNDSESPAQATWGMCWGTTGMTSSCPMSGGGGLPRDTDKSTCCNSAAEASMPWTTSDVNYQYYNPDVRYTAPVKADGTSYPDASTTAAKSDGFAGTGSLNLTTGWKHQVWCTTTSVTPTAADPTAGGKCLQNSDTTSSTNLLPDATHVYPKTYSGAPFYFKMSPSEYCRDDAMTDCQRVDANPDRSVYSLPSVFRWCASYTKAANGVVGHFNGCQKHRDTTHYIPNYLGSWNPTGAAPAFSYADITIDNAASSGQSINSLTIGGVQVLANDGAGNTLVGFGNTAGNPPNPGSGIPAVDTSANVYSTITLGGSFPFDQGLANYTTAPYDPPNQPYKYENYVNATLSSTTDIAKALCQAVHANAAQSGYDCPTAPTTATLRVQAANIGSAPNGKLVVTSGPAGATAASATASFTVTTATNNYQATALTVNTSPSQNLISGAVTANGNLNTTAQLLCQAIYNGPASGSYEAVSGGSSTYGSAASACLNGNASLTVRAKTTGTSMNGKTLTLTGPAVSTNYTGNITVNAVSANPGGGGNNWTKIDDITVGGTSILTAAQKALLKWDGSKTSTQIATDIANAIHTSLINSCDATSSNAVVTISGATCSGAIVVSAASVQASGKLRISAVTSCGAAAGCRQPNAANTPAQLGTSTANGGIKVGAVKIADNVPETTITDGTAVAANAASIQAKINALSTGLSAAAPSCPGAGAPAGTCDITVSTTDYRSTYNATSFTPQQGNFATAVAGTRPQWNFTFDRADKSKNIEYIRCGTPADGTHDLFGSNGDNIATTGTNNSLSTRLSSLRTGLNLLGNSASNTSYYVSCNAPDATPKMQCSLYGPVGLTECTSKANYGGGGSDCNANRDIVIKATDSTIDVANPASGGDSNHYCVHIATDGTGASGSAYNDFSSAVATASNFGNAYIAQSTSADASMSSVNSGPIAVNPNPATFAGGLDGTVLAIPTNATGNQLAMAGGADAASANSWQITGIFKRTDIVASNNAYTRGANRSDCVTTAGACTYTEELQNFANWYTYYRTRMLMMKSASTLAFNALDGKYRVGFDNISNCQGTCASTVVLPVAQFIDNGEVASQRSNWWTKLTSATPTSNTPLRSELAKIGRYYAYKLTGGNADPIQYSCQQNFAFLVTDGYWNEAESSQIKKVDGSDIGNLDNVAGTAPRPFYDGQSTPTTCPSLGSGSRSGFSSCRTLADIAWHYYSTDLRTSALGNATNASTGQDVSENNVPITSDDRNTAQHMVFYAMGLGVDGTLDFRPDYQTAGVGDYADIVAGTRNWPAVANLDPTGIDDLWHAAVNGHGKYFSARNPAAVLSGLTDALNKIGSRVGAAAAAATSNLEPVSGDNFAYVASYTTVDWTGDLQARTIDLATGAVSNATDCGAAGSGCNWSAQTLLDATSWSTRNIYIAPSSVAPLDPLRTFDYTLLSAAEKAYFDPSTLSQYATLSVSNPTDITAANLVDYLRGNRGLEQDGNAVHGQIWRQRPHILGDIVDTQPVFVKRPGFSYTDSGYSDFKDMSRPPVLYISAQDGMLHAFNAHTAAVTMNSRTVQPGGELWAFVPKEAMKVMKTLGDVNYTHRFFIDGQITVGDVYFGNAWHTILVAGLGGGGKAYIALDVTDPLNPLYLWEFTDTHLGYTYGNASINKLPTGEWAVFFSSGYNNDNNNGYLYAVKPADGTLFSGYPLATGSSNLGKLSVWANAPRTDNTGEFAYAGDLNGKLWRFDLSPNAAGHSGQAVFQLAQLADAGGTPQPITTRPEGTQLDDGTHVVYVGTGQYLGVPDLTTTTTQSFYAIKDTLGLANLGGASQDTWNPRTDSATIGGAANTKLFLSRKLIGSMDNNALLTKTVAGVTSNFRQICSGPNSQISHVDQTCINQSGADMDWAVYGGWYVDLPDSGERMNVDMNLSLGTLTFASNVPASNACTSGGYGWLNYLDYRTGLAIINTPPQVSSKVANALIVGINVVKLPSGAISAIVTTSDNQTISIQPSFLPTTFSGRRNLWREFEVF